MNKIFSLKLTALKPELVFWVVSLLLLFIMQPGNNEHSLCLFKFLNFPYCPGCGIGSAIHYALLLDFSTSWQNHYFGIPALCIILHRIYSLLRK